MASSALVSDIKGVWIEKGDPADDFEAKETGQHKYVETGEQIQLHDLFPSEVAATGAAKAGRE
jgi:hypothetical protein